MEFIDFEVPRLTGGRFVYRLWAEDDSCLYVGQHQGFHPAARIATHAAEKPWWPEVARIDFALVEDEDDLDEGERAEIKRLRPKHNGTWNNDRPSRSGVGAPAGWTRTSVLVDEETWAAFGEVCAAEGTDRSTVLRRYMADRVKKLQAAA